MPEQFTHRAVCELRTRGQVIKDPFVGQVVHVQIRCGHCLRSIWGSHEEEIRCSAHPKRLVSQQGKRVPSRHEPMLPPSNGS